MEGYLRSWRRKIRFTANSSERWDLICFRVMIVRSSWDLGLTVENYFQYIPNLGAAIFFAIVFALITIGTIVQSIRFRSGYMWVMAMGTACILLFNSSVTDKRDGNWIQFPRKRPFQSVYLSRLSHQPDLHRKSWNVFYLTTGSCADILPRNKLCYLWTITEVYNSSWRSRQWP